jgi:hypothetical protein
VASYASKIPGVYLEDIPRPPPPAFDTGAPVFLGSVASLPARVPVSKGIARLDLATWTQLDQAERASGASWASGHLGPTVRGFFQNGGLLCYVAHLAAPSALDRALAALEPSTDFDLVCAPGLADLDAAALSAAQAKILRFCAQRGDCFAILDSARNNLASKGLLIQGATDHRDALAAAIVADADAEGLDRESLRVHGGLYFPWVKVRGAAGGDGFVPPSGHVAGVYARIDRSRGFYKAPANEVVEGVFDLQAALGSPDHGRLVGSGAPNLNCLRSFPGRGIRVCGARTLSLGQEWLYVNVRRTVMTVRRWLEVFMTDFLFEPNDPRLWLRINREVTAFLDDLHRRGALEGATAPDAYFVKCDAENNPKAVRDAGQVVVEVGLAPATPREFLVVRLIHGEGGLVSVTAGAS